MVSLYTATNREGSKSAEGEAEPERAEDGNGTATTVSSALLIRPSGQEKVDVHIIRSRRLLGKKWMGGGTRELGGVGGLRSTVSSSFQQRREAVLETFPFLASNGPEHHDLYYPLRVIHYPPTPFTGYWNP